MQKKCYWPPLCPAVTRGINQIWKVMRLTTVLLITAFVSAHATGKAQHVTISGKNLTLKEVFTAIENQTGYVVLTSSDVFSVTTPISLSVADIPVKNLLDIISKNQFLNYVIQDKTIFLSRQPLLLQLTDPGPPAASITGKIVDSLGRPLESVSVRLLPGKKGTYTDVAGNFTFTGLEPGLYTLEASFVGYETYRKVIGVAAGESQQQLGSITLKPMAYSLTAVSVTYSTGYQNIPKERATGAFSTVSSDMLNKRPVSNISTALQGLVAGMQTKENEDGSMNLLIRGSSSLFADRRPLVVVDGFPISASDFSDINPNDVESITVLKDAAAASIWGARSANGVIVITTKKGKTNSKLKVEANVFTRIASITNLDQVLTQANSADQIAYERKAFENNWVSYASYAGSFYDITNSLTLAQELLYANQNGEISTADMNAGLDKLSKISNRSQVRDLLMQHAVLDQYNISMQSGNERSKTYASILYEKNKGDFVKNGYNRFNLNMSNDFRLAKFISFNIGANINYKKQENSGASIGEIGALSPYELLLNQDGSYGVNLNKYNREQLSLIPSDKFPYADWSYNLLQEVRGRKLTSENISARIQTGLNIQLMKGLSFDSKFQYERGKIKNEDYHDESTFFVRDLVNSMTEYDPDTKTVGRSYIPKGGILTPHVIYDPTYGYEIDEMGDRDLESYLIRNQLNFEKNINNKHAIAAIAGMELSQYTTADRINPYVYGYSPDKLQASVPPYGYGNSLNYLYDFMGNPTTLPGGNTQFGWERDKFVSFYGNASYTYNDKYSVSGSARSDASNFITANPKLRWSPLWSVGGKWNVKNEKFMDNNKIFDRLEMRLTYGKNGNIENSTSTKALLDIRSSLNANTNTIIGSILDNGNPKLRWEKTTTTNLGIDFGILSNKISGSIDLYNKIGKDIVGDIALPAATGTNMQRFNDAGIINRGVELTLGTNVMIPGIRVRYITNITYAYNSNKVNDLYNPLFYPYQLVDPSYAFVQGRPVNPVYTYTYLGMQDGVPQVAGPKGAPSSFNSTVLHNSGAGLSVLNYSGTATPPHTLGWVNMFEFHNFTLTAIFNGKFGGVYRDPVFDYGSALSGLNKTFVNKYVSQVFAGDPNVPGFANPNEQGLYAWDSYAPYLNTLIESSSYFECKELTLQYSLPAKLTRSIGFSSIRALAQARDLGLIWAANKYGYNPDWLPGTNRPAKNFTLGVNVQF